MKGKKEGGEIKGREGGKRKGGKGEGKKGEREKEFHSRARTRDLPLCSQPPMATAWRVDSHVRTIHVYIANFDFDDLTVAVLAALALPMTMPKYQTSSSFLS